MRIIDEKTEELQRSCELRRQVSLDRIKMLELSIIQIKQLIKHIKQEMEEL